jgi:aminopeptidase N
VITPISLSSELEEMKSKIFSLLVINLVQFSLSYQAEKFSIPKREVYGDLNNDGSLSSTSLAFETREASTGNFTDESGLSYRLPNNSLPIRYELWLKTDVDKGNFDFNGNVRIHVVCVETTKQITLHYEQIQVDKIDLYNTNNVLVQSGLQFEYDENLDFLIIELPRFFFRNERIILDISYNGVLRSDNQGFYQSTYANWRNFSIVNFAATHLKPTHARHVMPCYDEPSFRATISLKLQHDKSLNAISNMPLASQQRHPGTDYVTSTFEDTPIIQTYLLAFVISDFHSIGNNDVQVEQKVFARHERMADGHFEFTLSVMKPILEKFEEHLGVRYPLLKLDHVAIPTIGLDGLESFGMITYEELMIAFNPATAPPNRASLLIYTVSHMMAHQFFGNIVGPKWWSYTWLIEGFATLYQFYVPSLMYPEDEFFEIVRLDVQTIAFLNDVRGRNARPLNFYVESPENIKAKFDPISHDKAASVLLMIQEALTVPTFTKGINYYLMEMYFKAATPVNLHRSLQRAYDEDFPGNSLNIGSTMSTWEDQAGYPIIHVEKNGNKYTLTQRRVGGGDEIYSVPISYTTNSEMNFNDKSAKLWINSTQTEVEINEEFIALNIQLTGYYKTTYDNHFWPGIAEKLREDHLKIPRMHREQWFSDLVESLRDTSVQAVNGLELLSYLHKEGEVSVWTHANRLHILNLRDQLFATSVMENYQRFMQFIIKPKLDDLGFEDRPTDSLETIFERSFFTVLSCESFQQECLENELQNLVNAIETGRGSFFECFALRLANETIHSTRVDLWLNRRISTNNLGCSLNPTILKNLLKLSLDTSNSLTDFDRRNLIDTTFFRSATALEVTLKFFMDYYKKLDKM